MDARACKAVVNVQEWLMSVSASQMWATTCGEILLGECCHSVFVHAVVVVRMLLPANAGPIVLVWI